MMRNLESWKGESFWNEQRRVYVTLSEHDFVAQGVNETSGQVVFQVQGKLEQLARFSEQVTREGAAVVVGRPRKAGEGLKAMTDKDLPDLPLTGNTSDDPPPPPGPPGGDKDAKGRNAHLG